MVDQHIGICLTGKSFSGKSTIINILIEQLRISKRNVVYHKINPKSVSKHDLFGHYDSDGLEFQDGIFVKILRGSFQVL